MADNYTLWSTTLQKLNAKELAWAKEILNNTVEEIDSKTLKILKGGDLEDWPGFDWDHEVWPEGEVLYLYSDEGGNADNAALFIHAFLRKFRKKQCAWIDIAHTCSKPRPDQFGGGALFITADGIESFSTGDWIARKRKAFERKVA